jgi:hypothetical protein
MTSQINYNSIDEKFPITGRDNTAQGFRNNFSSTKNALLIANEEISELQNPLVKVMSDENEDTAIDVYIDDSRYQTYDLIADTNFGVAVRNIIPGHLYQTKLAITNPTASTWDLQFTGATYVKFQADTFLDNNFAMSLAPGETVIIDSWTINFSSAVYLNVLGVV